MAKKYSMFPSAPSVSAADSVVGLHNGENSRFSFATILSFIQSLFVPTSRKVNNKALTDDISLNASDVGAVDTADVGVADGVASLDGNGKVPGTQLDLSGKQDKITASGILKGDGQGGVSAATPGTDYTKPTTYPSATITVTDPTYATSASIDGIIRQDNFCTLAITIVLAGQIPTTRVNVAQVHGIPRTVNNVTGIMQVTNYLFAVQLQPGGVVNLMAIGQAQGGSGWTGRVQIPYITDGTLTA